MLTRCKNKRQIRQKHKNYIGYYIIILMKCPNNQLVQTVSTKRTTSLLTPFKVLKKLSFLHTNRSYKLPVYSHTSAPSGPKRYVTWHIARYGWCYASESSLDQGILFNITGNLITKLAGSTWGASARTLRTATLALCFSVAEYCAPVWCRSSHTKLVDIQLNSAMRTISGSIMSTPVLFQHSASTHSSNVSINQSYGWTKFGSILTYRCLTM